MNRLGLKARAKINFALDVVNRREDGKHNLKMIMQTITLYDYVLLNKIKNNAIIIKSNSKAMPLDERNIVYKAADCLKKSYGINQGIVIDIDKRIPICAGMAGGSTDAAAVLIGMNKLFDLGIEQENLCKIGLELGADVPYCIKGGTALAEGVGEILTQLPPFMRKYVLVVKPHIGVSTRNVFSVLDINTLQTHPDVDGMALAIREGDYAGVLKRLGNSLEEITFALYPVIAELKEKIKETGADGVLMSGSGSTVFGLFSDKEKVIKACGVMRRDKRTRFVCVSETFNG